MELNLSPGWIAFILIGSGVLTVILFEFIRSAIKKWRKAPKNK